MSVLRDRRVTMAITTIIIAITLVSYYINIPVIISLSKSIYSWAIVLATISLGLGFINILIRWIPNIQRQESEWYFQAWSIFLMLFMLLTGISTKVYGQHPLYVWMYTNVQVPLDATIYSLLGFYIASAVFRAFRSRSFESALFLLAGVFLIMRNAPIVEYWLPGQSNIGNWIMNNISMGARRGVAITVALGTLAFLARTIIGKERGVTA
jgi:hypothetical protein